MDSFGKTINYFRNLKGMTVEQVAAKLNILPAELIGHENDPQFLTLELHDSLCKIYSICPFEPFEHYFDIESA